MEQPTIGRRRQRTGGVTVAELVDRQRSTPTGTAPSTTDEPGTVTVGDTAVGRAGSGCEAVPAAPDRGTSKMAKASRVAGLTIGMLALCGAVAAAWTIDGKDKHPTPAAAPRLEITGLDALRPDLLATRLGDRSTGPADEDRARQGTATTANSTSGGHYGSGSAGGDDRQDRSTSGADAARSDATGQPGLSPTAVVRRFYKMISTHPNAAIRLLDPKLTGSDVQSLVHSWNDTRQVVVENVADNGDGAVTAVVRLLRPDGSWLRVRQLLNTTPGEMPRISTVRTLSVQRG